MLVQTHTCAWLCVIRSLRTKTVREHKLCLFVWLHVIHTCIYCVQCTVYTVHCTLCTVQWHMYQSMVRRIHGRVANVYICYMCRHHTCSRSTVYNSHYTVYNTYRYYTLYIVQCTLYNVHWYKLCHIHKLLIYITPCHSVCISLPWCIGVLCIGVLVIVLCIGLPCIYIINTPIYIHYVVYNILYIHIGSFGTV